MLHPSPRRFLMNPNSVSDMQEIGRKRRKLNKDNA
jgi:hypothetical protein